MSVILYFPTSHDPSGQPRKFMFRILPDPGIGLVNATVTVVDANDQPIILTDLIISDVSFAALTDGSGVWGVAFYASGGDAGSIYLLRCRYTTTDAPTEGSDITMRLRVENT